MPRRIAPAARRKKEREEIVFSFFERKKENRATQGTGSVLLVERQLAG